MPQRSPQRALDALIAGNDRFLSGTGRGTPFTPDDLRAHAAGQDPFAVILGCADSRVPAEILFDQGFGDLFMIRVAGAVVAPSLVGSMEFAITSFTTRLIVVMGHTRCGVIDATIRALASGEPPIPGLRDIVERTSTPIAPLVGSLDGDALYEGALRASVRASVEEVRASSDLLRAKEAAGDLRIIGAICDIATGAVEFLDR